MRDQSNGEKDNSKVIEAGTWPRGAPYQVMEDPRPGEAADGTMLREKLPRCAPRNRAPAFEWQRDTCRGHVPLDRRPHALPAASEEVVRPLIWPEDTGGLYPGRRQLARQIGGRGCPQERRAARPFAVCRSFPRRSLRIGDTLRILGPREEE